MFIEELFKNDVTGVGGGVYTKLVTKCDIGRRVGGTCKY